MTSAYRSTYCLYYDKKQCQSKLPVLHVFWGRILGPNPDKRLKSFPPLLFTVTSTALLWGIYFFKLTQPLTVSIVNYSTAYTIKEKTTTLPYGLRNPYRNLKSDNSEDYAQKSPRNFSWIWLLDQLRASSVLPTLHKIFGQTGQKILCLSKKLRLILKNTLFSLVLY